MLKRNIHSFIHSFIHRRSIQIWFFSGPVSHGSSQEKWVEVVFASGGGSGWTAQESSRDNCCSGVEYLHLNNFTFIPIR